MDRLTEIEERLAIAEAHPGQYAWTTSDVRWLLEYAKECFGAYLEAVERAEQEEVWAERQRKILAAMNGDLP